MPAVIAIVGRPNVGKSTLFNHLTRSDTALVDDRPGVTRDRLVGEIRHHDQRALLVDTGGLGMEAAESAALAERVTEQSLQAVREADRVLWLVDGRTGLCAEDESLAALLRPMHDHIQLVVNKTEGLDPDIVSADFYQLGMGTPLAISSKRGQGISRLLDLLFTDLPAAEPDELPEHDSLRVAMLGRPNAGKSTLINRLLGEKRMLTFDQPGTTRDSVAIPFERDGRQYTLIDTAGLRRRSQVEAGLEKTSVVKSLKAIDASEVVILVVDSRIGVTDQDAHLLGLAVDRGKALIIALNKWDGMSEDDRERTKVLLDQKLAFADYAQLHFISALHGTGVGEMFRSVARLRDQFERTIGTPLLTDCLERALATHQPPLIHGRRIKLRYAHLASRKPLKVMIHGNQVGRIPDAYKRYLARSLREQLQLEGLPLLLEFKQGENPYAGRKNPPKRKKVRRRRD